MPDIEVAKDEHGRQAFVCEPLDGEDPRLFLKPATQISSAGFYLRDYTKNPEGIHAQSNYNEALKILVRYMPEDVAHKLAKAYINKDTHLKVTVLVGPKGIVFKGISEE